MTAVLCAAHQIWSAVQVPVAGGSCSPVFREAVRRMVALAQQLAK
jgi:hypothetical protein